MNPRPPGRCRRAPLALSACFALLTLAWRPAAGAEISVAVAANFIEPLEALATQFRTETGHVLQPSGGSTGKLYAQIRNGAPYDVFLAADQERPQQLEADGAAVPGSRFTYSIGRLTLWSADPDMIQEDGAAVLRRGDWRHLALASPELAPYGEAARQVLQRLGLWDRVESRLVRGENISQTFQFVSTGNAQLGFVALSQVRSPRNRMAGSRWDVPQDLHDPIRQDAVLLRRAADSAAAKAFLTFLRGPDARATIQRFGYGVED